MFFYLFIYRVSSPFYAFGFEFCVSCRRIPGLIASFRCFVRLRHPFGLFPRFCLELDLSSYAMSYPASSRVACAGINVSRDIMRYVAC